MTPRETQGAPRDAEGLHPTRSMCRWLAGRAQSTEGIDALTQCGSKKDERELSGRDRVVHGAVPTRDTQLVVRKPIVERTSEPDPRFGRDSWGKVREIDERVGQPDTERSTRRALQDGLIEDCVVREERRMASIVEEER